MKTENQQRQNRDQAKQWARTLNSSKDPGQRRLAANALYNAFHSRLVLYFMKKIGNHDGRGVHDDLAQETLCKAFRKIHLYDPDAAEFSTWIYRIAHNSLIDDRRQYKGHDMFSMDAMSEEADTEGMRFELPSHHEGSDALSLRQENRSLIASAMAKMVKQEAYVLTLRFYEELSYEEIVERMGLPMGTVKPLIHRAKASLKKLLDPAMVLTQ